MIIIPIQEKPFPKKDLSLVLSRQKIAWLFVLIIQPLLGIFTVYLFETYTDFTRSALINTLLAVQIGYSLYAISSIVHEGIKIEHDKLKKYNSNDLIYFTAIVNKFQLNRFYIGLILYAVLGFTMILQNV